MRQGTVQGKEGGRNDAKQNNIRIKQFSLQEMLKIGKNVRHVYALTKPWMYTELHGRSVPLELRFPTSEPLLQPPQIP